MDFQLCLESRGGTWDRKKASVSYAGVRPYNLGVYAGMSNYGFDYVQADMAYETIAFGYQKGPNRKLVTSNHAVM